MSKDEILDAVHKLLMQDSGNLSREEYRDLLEATISECRDALNALDEDGEDE